jgi:hypothetical protein
MPPPPPPPPPLPLQDGEYGKHRLWGAIGWGGISTLAGWLIATRGIHVVFPSFLLVSLPAVVLAWHMPFGQLYQGQGEGQGRGQEGQEGQRRLSGRGAGSSLELSGPGGSGEAPDEESQKLLPLPAETPVYLQAHAQAEQPQLGQVQAEGRQGGGAGERRMRVLVEEERAAGFLVQQRHRLAVASGPQSFEEVDLTIEDADAAPDQASRLSSPTWSPSPRKQQQQQQQEQLGGGKGGLHEGGGPQEQQQGQGQRVEFWAGLRQMLSTPAVLVFMWQAVVMGFGVGCIGEYLFLYLQVRPEVQSSAGGISAHAGNCTNPPPINPAACCEPSPHQVTPPAGAGRQWHPHGPLPHLHLRL